jgi:hypothetical protein
MLKHSQQPTPANRRLGSASATVGLSIAALNLCNGYRKKKNLCPISEAVYAEFEADNLENFFLGFTCFCASTPIPTHADEDLMPKKAENKRCVMVSTLKKYIGQAKEELRRKFPEHPDFTGLKSNDDPSWYTGMLAAFERECNRFHMKIKGNEDIVFGDTTTHPIYRNATADQDPENDWQLEDNDEAGGAGGKVPKVVDYISLVDLKFICKKLLRESTFQSTNLQSRAILITLWMAAGRGGEVKFVDFSEWQYHPKLGVTDIGWTELKVLEKYSMPMIPDREGFWLDTFHAWGCYWAVEKGLYRNESAKISGHSNYLFPDLHNMTDARVAAHITTMIRRCLPAGCGKEIQAAFSAKSTRKGAVTEMSVHPECDILSVCARSGHSTGLSIDYYNDKTNISRGLPGAKALAGYKHLKNNVAAPRLECLGAHNKATILAFMDSCFVINIPYFQRGAKLFPVLKVVMATLIMYHQDVTRELSPSNAVATHLRECARRLNLKDAHHPQLCPEKTLDMWSALILQDFKLRNPEITSATPELASIAESLNQLATANMDLKATINLMMRQNDERHQQWITQTTQMQSWYEDEIATLKEELSKQQRKTAVLRSPDSAASYSDRRVRRRINTDIASEGNVVIETPVQHEILPATDHENPTVACSPNNDVAASLTAPTTAIATASGLLAPARLVYGAKSRQVAEGKSQQGINISVLLAEMHETNCFYNFHEKFHKNDNIPPQFHEKQLARNSLQIVEAVITNDERKKLTEKFENMEDKDRLDLYMSIQDKVLSKMWEYEGDDPEVKRKEQKKKAGAKIKPTYIAIGKRVHLYKTKIYMAQHPDPANQNKKEIRHVELIEHNEIPVPQSGTPPGNKSIRQMLGF